MAKEELIAEIEAAFDRTSPRGLRITIDSGMGDYPEVRNHFHHRDWWTCDASYLKQQDGAFTFMTDEARVYFTPAFMIASLRDPITADTVPDDFVGNLKEDLLKYYSPVQLQTIRRFIEFHFTDEPWNDPNWREQHALVERIEQTGGGKV